MTTKNIAKIAKICHEANRVYCEMGGDTTQLAWNEAANWQRDSAVAGVKWRLANLDALCSCQHDAWMKDKLDNGWKYGPVKNPEILEHPCLVPYNELPSFQRGKDHLFVAIVMSLKDFLGD